jgi:hypothetical protein
MSSSSCTQGHSLRVYRCDLHASKRCAGCSYLPHFTLHRLSCMRRRDSACCGAGSCYFHEGAISALSATHVMCVFLAGKSPEIQSYAVHIYGSGQP